MGCDEWMAINDDGGMETPEQRDRDFAYACSFEGLGDPWETATVKPRRAKTA
jgi:hypothetical protein